jgi:acyl-[acyl-carrier-protein]-phospholipid O-acyltransferase/long-chain-fatty-acid--[acyl-carrier-protein] ligase
VSVIHLEDLTSRVGAGQKLCAALYALFAPTSWIGRGCGADRRPTARDVATVIFSSGSTGEPKGVLLSHASVGANVEAVAQVVRLERHDRILGILPQFHSFGYLTLWVALNEGLGIVFHPSPVDAAAVGHLVDRYAVTMLLTTPTFLQIYARRCTPDQFGSLDARSSSMPRRAHTLLPGRRPGVRDVC